MPAPTSQQPRQSKRGSESQSQWGIKSAVYKIVFESDTRAGQIFDIILLAAIVSSVLIVMLDSVGSFHRQHETSIEIAEWVFTTLFTIEYALRIYCVPNRLKYATSFFGIIDLMSILPAYISLFIAGQHYLMVIRVLRLLRVFRIFKLTRYLTEANVLMHALRASREKITVFIGAVLTLVVIIGALMYIVEGSANGFTSIPKSIYWAIVTLTTVGYGDLAPKTTVGQVLASVVMIMGYGIIAVPTGIVTVEIQEAKRKHTEQKQCPGCGRHGHDRDALFCDRCGTRLQLS